MLERKFEYCLVNKMLFKRYELHFNINFPFFYLERSIMNKQDLIDALRYEVDLKKTETDAIVRLFFNEMSDALAKGDRVEIRGLCSIFVKKYTGYTGRNPKTGKKIKVKTKKLPFFKCGRELKKRVDSQN